MDRCKWKGELEVEGEVRDEGETAGVREGDEDVWYVEIRRSLAALAMDWKRDAGEKA